MSTVRLPVDNSSLTVDSKANLMMVEVPVTVIPRLSTEGSGRRVLMPIVIHRLSTLWESGAVVSG